MAVGADLDAVLDRVGQVRDQRAGLGVDLAALQAEAAVDAVRPVAERAVGDRRPARRASRCPRARAPAQAPLGGAGDRVRARGGSGADHPTASPARRPAARARPARSAAAGPRRRSASRRRRRRACASRSRRGGSAACSRRSGPSSRRRRGPELFLPSSTGSLAADDPLVRSSRAGARRPRRRPSRASGSQNGPRSSTTIRQPRAGQPLGQHDAAGAGADDQQVDLVVVAVARASWPRPGRPRRCDVEQEARVVVRRPTAPLSSRRAGPHRSPRRSTSCDRIERRSASRRLARLALGCPAPRRM